MAENINSIGGVVGSVAVTTVNSALPQSTGTYVPASVVEAGLAHQVDGVPVAAILHPAGLVNADGTISGPPPTTLPVTSSSVKKTSFQITSVTVDSSASNDGGDDSADDLDESHTEDSSDVATDASRHTSESRGTHPPNDDNFTRNDIFYNPAPPSSMNIAPVQCDIDNTVIPTSSQYGLAIVPEGINPTPEVPPPAPPVMNDPASEKPDPDKDVVHNRFKVVKIVSTEPFKKGRWMCMDYFDHTTTTSGASSTKDTTPPQAQPQAVPQTQTHSNIQQPIQPVAEKIPVNIVNVQQGSNVPVTTSPPQPSHSINNVLPDSQQQATIMQQTQPPQQVIQSQLQSNLHDPEGSINSSGLPNGNGAHYQDYHVNHSHNVQQAVNLNHVTPASTVTASDNSAFSTPIPNHSAAISASGNAYQGSLGQQQQQQQQQQQYYNSSGVMAGIPQRTVSVAPTSSIPSQQQSTIASQQQQQPLPIPAQVPVVQNQSQPQQSIGQIGPQSSISQNTSLISQTMSTAQIHQTAGQVSQPSHLPAQSLPHGAHAQMTASTSIANAPAPSASVPQQPQHTAQSLGHNMLQQNKPAFMNQQQQHQQQSQSPAPSQFTQQQCSQQQPQMMTTQQGVMGNQQNSTPQNLPVSQVPQSTATQQTQQQPQSYQTGVMIPNMTGLQQQQVHVQQMNPANVGVSQHSVQMQQSQPTSNQAQGIYTAQGQMMGHTMQMGGQTINMQQPTQGMMQQPSVIQNQTMIQQQTQMQQPQQQQQQQQQHHQQQMMGMAPQQQQSQQPIVSQPQSSTPQQPIMTQPQMISQMMQNTQMSGMVTQSNLVAQPGVITQQQGMISQQSNIPQQSIIQQLPPQQSYPSQTQPQTINNQPSMQQPLMQQYSQPSSNQVVVQQQQMMPLQSQTNMMTPQMTQSMTQGQQQQIPLQQQQQSQPSQQQQQQQQQPAPQPQVSMSSQTQQPVYQTPPQQMQVSQANVVQQNLTSMQSVHNMMPPVPQNVPQNMPQIPASTGMTLQTSNANDPGGVTIVNGSVSVEPPSQQQTQPVIQQQQSVPAQAPQATAVPSPAESQQHATSQNASSIPQGPPVTSSATSVPLQTITSLSAAATVIIDGVHSLGETEAARTNGGNEESGENTSNVTTAAIDDKIEQAMILVSQHIRTNVNKELMDLKQKISVLLERISQLESENNYLRNHASEETLRSLDACASGDRR